MSDAASANRAATRRAAGPGPIFLIGSGRSGTTLVQRILNSYPDTTVWGEHDGVLEEFSEAFFRLVESPSMEEFVYSLHGNRTSARAEHVEAEGTPANWLAWYNWFDREDVPMIFRECLESIFFPTLLEKGRTWGFKEIRYGRGDRVIEFLHALYPDARFVFVVRNGLNTVESQLTTFFAGESRWLAAKRLLHINRLIGQARAWAQQNETLLAHHRSGRLRSSWICYEELVEDPDVLAPLLESLGKELGPEQLAVMSMKEGRGTSFDAKSSVNERWRRMGPIGLAVALWTLGGVYGDLGYRAPRGYGWLPRLRRRLARKRPPEILTSHPVEKDAGGR